MRVRSFLLCFSSILGLLFVGQDVLFGQDSTSLEQYRFDELTVIDKRLLSLNNYAEIQPEKLTIKDATHLSQSLNLVPGVLMHSGALNTNRITIRGIGNRSLFATAKIKAFLDDIPLTNGTGETTVEDIDLSILRTVNVWKGPTASRFGSGLGGMIDMQSRKSFAPGLQLSSSASFGSYGLRRFVQEGVYGGDDEHQFVYVNYNRMHSDGYRDNNEYNRQSVFLLGGTKVLDGELSVLFNYTKLKAFIPSSLNEDDFLEDPRQAAFTWGNVKGFEDNKKWLLGLSYRKMINKNWRVKIAASSSGRNSLERRPFNVLDDESITFNMRAWVEHEGLFSGKLLWRFGGEAFQEQYNWKTFETLDGAQGALLSVFEEGRNYQNIFSEASYYCTPQFKIKAGLNLNFTNYRLQDLFLADTLNQSGSYGFNPILSPRIIFSYQTADQQQFYITTSHGFSPPGVEETLNPDQTINPEIQPEKGWNFELGSRGSLWTSRLRYEVAIFDMLVKDLLVAQRTAEDQFIGVNAGSTNHFGIEGAIEFDIIKREEHSLVFNANYAYQDFKFLDFIDGESDFSGNDLTGTSPHHFNGILSGSLGGFYANLHFRYLAGMPLRDDNSVYSESFALVNSKIGFKKKFKNRLSFEAFCGIANLLDKRYASMFLINAGSFGGNLPRYYYPGLPRNYFGGLKLSMSLRSKQ